MRTETIPCHCCSGTGRVEFTGVFADTLTLLRKQRRPITPTAMATIDGCKVTAMCNRLEALERLGFAKSHRYGRTGVFTAIKTTTND
jgi:hypothetical protein